MCAAPSPLLPSVYRVQRTVTKTDALQQAQCQLSRIPKSSEANTVANGKSKQNVEPASQSQCNVIDASDAWIEQHIMHSTQGRQRHHKRVDARIFTGKIPRILNSKHRGAVGQVLTADGTADNG